MAGTISRGIKAPIIRQGDDIVKIVADSVLAAAAEDGFQLQERDVVCVTEAVVARADGNYASTDDIASDVKAKLGGETIGVVFPILSRNRFAICLRGIAKGAKKVVLMLSYPSDEVGNHLFDMDLLDDSGINPYNDVLSLDAYRNAFGYIKHPFTGVDYVDYYKTLIEEEGAEAEIIFANHPEAIVKFTKNVLCCDIHTRERSKRRILAAGGEKVCTLDEILMESINGSGFNPSYGLLGSNKATETTVKLFPKNAQEVAEQIQKELIARTGVTVEAMIYGDGAFKDPVGKIWELADPVVGAGYTEGLVGLPNEVKLKYLADNDFADLSGAALEEAIRQRITEKEADLKGSMASEGTTPRRLTDLIGSLCDLTSGSGDKGTPIVLVQNYFNNFAN
ncbi:coenzyme F420-0:L-glutamate ligase [Anaerotignum sp. MB30-C6]|uniref:coenzyme F420-0:L-glutamate ligase n=1 Tax=Anaerotignum sp. MB30-C6 TaxID=3070814 RepID=UPI0027DAF10D|nr:coenzyme F420-0:L-glutamate ligase [Anaerotignum sp. MB30-C6]WMI81311.1 coenzyme F420-0:L-glutamate ligase [Anaerotignum sp. MB30-C6]